jgi:hypothetical protein
MKKRFFLALAVATGTLTNGHAAELGPVDIHGFAAQSIIFTDNNQFFGDSEDGSLEFTELGLNGLWNATDRLSFAAQIVARDAGETDDGKIRLDYGFAEYKFLSNTDRVLGLRLGRAVNPYGFYNESRDVAASRPSVLLPQSIYFDRNRNLALSSDGGYLFFDSYNDWGDLQLTASVYEPRTRDPELEPAVFGAEQTGRWQGKQSWMARIIYDYDFGRIRLGLTAAEINLMFDGSDVPIFNDLDFTFSPIILSAQYQTEQWTFVAEYAERTTELASPVFAPFNVEFTGSSYYVQGAYRFNQHWSILARYDDLVQDDDDPDGSDYEAAGRGPAHLRFAQDWTLGLRWDINKHYMLSIEAHNIEGTGWLSVLDNTDASTLEESWIMLLFTVSGKF